MNHKRIIIALTAFICLSLFIVIFFGQNNPKSSSNTPYLTIQGHKVELILAQTPSEHRQGLSNHPPLPVDTGMLFIFSEPTQGTFWMKDMLFSLDLIWIFHQKIIVIHKNIPPPFQTNGVPQVISPNSTYDRVLEITGGWSDQHQIKVGDEVIEFLN